MATAVDICNLSLSLLGDSATVTSINPADGSPQSGHCARWYPFALRKVLEQHDWSFAVRRVRLAELSSFKTEIYDWDHAYGLPSDCLRVIRAYDPDLRVPEEFEVENNVSNKSRVLLTNAKECVISYVAYVDTPTIFPVYFIQAVTLLLASYLVGPLKRADTTSQLAQGLLQQYQQVLQDAINQDCKTAIHRAARRRLPDSLRVREV